MLCFYVRYDLQAKTLSVHLRGRLDRDVLGDLKEKRRREPTETD